MNPELEKLHNRLINNCKDKNKKGCQNGIIIENGQFVDCPCMEQFKKQAVVISANIPRKYRDFKLSNLTDNFRNENISPLKIINKYVSNIAYNIEQGYGLFFQSAAGLGKTALSCWILMKALQVGKTAYYTQYNDLITLFYNKLDYDRTVDVEAQIQSIMRADIVCIDRIDSGYLKNSNDYAYSKIDEIINHLYNNQAALLLTSNVIKQEIKGPFTSISDELVEIILTGTPYRSDSKAIREIMT